MKISSARPAQAHCKRPRRRKLVQRQLLSRAVSRLNHLAEGGQYFANQHDRQSNPTQHEHAETHPHVVNRDLHNGVQAPQAAIGPRSNEVCTVGMPERPDDQHNGLKKRRLFPQMG